MPRHKKTIVEYRNYILPVNFPILLLTGSRWRISDIKSGRLHFHNCMEIGICHSDSGTMEIEDKSVPFKAGDITFIPKDLPHTTYSDKGVQSLWSYLFLDTDELFRGIFEYSAPDISMPIVHSSPNPFLIIHKEEHPKIHFLAEYILEEMKEQKSNYQSSVRGMLLALCIELFRIQKSNELSLEKKETPENALVISPALEYIRKNYMQQFSIEDLAMSCHLSVTHFRRVFNDIMGTSPLDYINKTRIYKACSLLKSTEEAILSISEQVGFHSVSSFNRYFIKVIGVSPRTWRNQILQSENKSEKQSIFEFSGWI